MTTTTKPTRDPDFFFDLIVFQVEDTTFRVPKHYFAKDIGIFSTTLSLPTPPGGPKGEIEGSSEECPFVLEGITKKDFKAFLSFLYPPVLSSTRELSEEEWVSVLDLSSLWQAQTIRSLAIHHLRQLWDKQANYTSRILHGYRHDMQDWIIEGFTYLARRQRGLSPQEARVLGPEATRIVYEIRELTFKERVFYPDYKPFVEKVLRESGAHPGSPVTLSQR